MELNNFLKVYFNQLSPKNICESNNFDTYENFSQFIENHYELHHVEMFNYIKYVKIKRQILKLKEEIKYDKVIKDINSIIEILASFNTFPNVNIKKYFYKINVFFKLIEDKKNALLNTVNIIRSLFDLKDDPDFRIKILNSLNSILYRYKIFLKYSKKLIFCVNKLLNLENSYGIDHKLIELNNEERCILGKKSEYTANKIIYEYIKKMNKKFTNREYYYETNVDFLKFLNINLYHDNNIKGEVDGMIIYYDGCDYIIEKLIEVKSSIKSTLDDIKKFSCLQEYINNIDFETIIYNNYVFTKKSFYNIINKHLSEWTVYICINGIYKDVIEKSHLYFSNVLKIVDDKFIKNYYIDNNQDSTIIKYKIIVENKDLINKLFESWKNDIKFDTEYCNIFISKVI